MTTMHLQAVPSRMPAVPSDPATALDRLLHDGVTWGDSSVWLPRLPAKSVDLFFTSPPYADQRAYSRIHPDRYVEWFLPFARAMYEATSDTGSLVINIKNRVAKDGPLRGQRHPYVFQLVIALQNMGWRWIEEYIWQKPNAIPGKFGPRTKDAFEHVFHFARGASPTSTSTRCGCRTRPRLMRSSGASSTPTAGGTRKLALVAIASPLTGTAGPIPGTSSP